jgi:hypothetical protein
MSEQYCDNSRKQFPFYIELLRRGLVFGFVVLAGLCLSACATGYRASDGGKGFADAQISSNEFQVSFAGNGRTSLEQAYDFVLLRSTEVVLQHGCPYFAVMDTTNTSSARAYTARQRYYTNDRLEGGSGPLTPGVFNRQSGSIVEVAEQRTYFQPGTVLRIKCFPTKPAKPFTYDAVELQQTLKTKYKLH